MMHMVWKHIKLQHNQWQVIWSFRDGVFAKTLKTTRRPTTTRKLIRSVEPFHIVIFSFFVSCFHISRRVAPCISTPLLHSKHKIIEIQNSFVQLCADKPLTEISIPLLLWFPSLEYNNGGFICSKLVLLPPRLFVGCGGWFLKSVVGRILDFSLSVKDGGWLQV